MTVSERTGSKKKVFACEDEEFWDCAECGNNFYLKKHLLSTCIWKMWLYLFQMIVNIYIQPRNAKEMYINVKASLLSTFIINKEYLFKLFIYIFCYYTHHSLILLSASYSYSVKEYAWIF